MKVAVIFDDVEARPDASDDEYGVLEAVGAVEESLDVLGHRAVRVPVGGSATRWLTELERAEPDAVFNLCEGLNGSSACETNVAAVVELLGPPVTGNSAETLALARRKDHVNAIVAAAGVRVPVWHRVAGFEPLTDWERFPAIVKPAAEDASIGITQRSVVRNSAELAAALLAVRPFGVALVQEFITGRELNVGIVGQHVLPIAEIDFGALPTDAWPIVSYRAKWESGSDEDIGTSPVCPAHLDATQAERVVNAAISAWRSLDGRGYGRVDFRLAEDGWPYVLEVNPNPDLSPFAGLARMALASGWPYAELVARILEDALVRARGRRPAAPAPEFRSAGIQ